MAMIAARVIPWEAPDVWGIAVELRDGSRIAHEVGSLGITELECRRIENGERPLWGPLMEQDL